MAALDDLDDLEEIAEADHTIPPITGQPKNQSGYGRGA